MRIKSIVILFSLFIGLGYSPSVLAEQTTAEEIVSIEQTDSVQNPEDSSSSEEAVMGIASDHEEEAHGEEKHAEPAPWSVIPFVLLLLMIATGPLFYAHFWHKRYPAISVGLGALVAGYYLIYLGDFHHPVHSLAEYVSFIALVGSLFVASGGILIKVDKEGTPMVNSILLMFGAVIANVIGTTGASMLLIRPFIRLNRERIKAYQIVFFIFIVSNVGGALTPIGDPPLFLGFLKGVPFFWTLEHLWIIWLTGILMLTAIFFFIDKRNHRHSQRMDEQAKTSGKIEIKGSKNLIWLGVIIGAVFLDPNVVDWVPYIDYHGDKVSFLREVIMIAVAFLSYILANKDALKGNEFDFEPIREVAFLFVGIFATMMPALQLIGAYASNNPEIINVNSLYWFTGGLSGVLDNAPTYLNFLAAGMGSVQPEALDIASKADVLKYANEHIFSLEAISIAAVFFGAFTYIGNAPNFMVKSIAEQVGIQMPAFMSYIVKYSIPILLPVLFVIWLLFFALPQWLA